MRKLVITTVVLGIIFNATVFTFRLKPSPELQMLFMLMLLGMLLLLPVTFVLVFALWKRYRFRSFLPFCITAASIVLLLPTARVSSFACDCIFRARLPQYEAVIRDMINGKIAVPAEGGRIDLPERYSHLAYATLADKDANGILTVEFLTGGGFPVKHWGYLYRSHGSLSEWEYADRWPHQQKIEDHWYWVAD